MSPKVLIATTTFGVFDSRPEQRLKDEGFEVIKNPHGRKMSTGELVALGKDCVGVIAGTEMYTDDVIGKMPLLRMISRVGVGMDNIAFNRAQQSQVKVTPTATTPTSAVAELALGLILDGLRLISQHHALMKSGRWEKMMGSLLEGKTLGIIGLGKIGKRLVKLTRPFDLSYRATDLHPDHTFAKENGVEFCSLEKLLADSDVVSIHLSPTPEATSLIDEARLKLMKPHAIIINTSRGEVIHEPSLVAALKEGRLGAAALDVFENEPYTGPLLGLDNVIVTPHIAAYAREVRSKMELESVENLLTGLGVSERQPSRA